MGTEHNFHQKQVKGTFSSTFLLVRTSLAPGDGLGVEENCGVCKTEMLGQRGQDSLHIHPIDTLDLLSETPAPMWGRTLPQFTDSRRNQNPSARDGHGSCCSAEDTHKVNSTLQAPFSGLLRLQDNSL